MNNEGILKAARDRMSAAQSADENNRIEAKSDIDHINGKHWDDDVKKAREAQNRPCLTLNLLPQFVRGVTGDIRRMNPAINISPGDTDASEETAEIIEGLIRYIEYDCDASSVYEMAASDAARAGIGHWRILNEYENDTDFNQVLKIKRIHNIFSVLWDPASREPTRSDADYCFVMQEMSEDDFAEAYPKAAKIPVQVDTQTTGMEHWRQGTNVVVAEYFWKEPTTKTIAMLRSGQIVENPKAPLDIVKRRVVKTHKVMWAKVSGTEVLEGPTEFPSKFIPVVSVVGEEIDTGSEVVRTSVIRHAKDPARLYNYFSSADAEYVALQPKAPFILTKKQVEGREADWAAANDSNAAYLVYTADQTAPPPQRAMPPLSASGLAQQALKAVDDMKATTGIYDAGLGARSNEQSGVAIRQRQMESDVANSIYSDNLAKSIAHSGRILVDMIGKVYDTTRVVRILGRDDAEKLIEINQRSFEAGGRDGNRINVGTYTVRVSVGPNYSTRRQETAESMMQFIREFPAAAALVGDLVADSMDWPNKEAFVDRLKKMIPPDARDPEQITPEEQQQAQAAMQAQQVASEIAEERAETDLQEAAAKADEAEAKAELAALEVEAKELELAARTGQINDAIAQIVQAEVARVLQGTLQQGQGPQY